MPRDNYNLILLPFLASLGFFIFATPGIHAQEKPEACKEIPESKDFFVVDDVRSRLQREVPQLESRIKEINEVKLPQVAKAEKDLAENEKKLQVLTAKPIKSEFDLKQIEGYENVKASINGVLDGHTSELYRAELKQATDDLSWRSEQLKCVNTIVAGFNTTPEQLFKQTMSIIFSVLIGAVILGFFLMAWVDSGVRNAIFSGQTGLQFVTLFSIVIAIILFGITGVLGDKELGALLGGLSGYILGRSAVPRIGTASDTSDGVKSAEEPSLAPPQLSTAPDVV